MICYTSILAPEDPPIVVLLYKVQLSKQKQLNSILFALKSQRESITDVVVLAVASDSQQWVTYLDNYAAEIEQLMTLTPNKRCFYRRGMRAATQIRSSS
jgi:hypothetical protein